MEVRSMVAVLATALLFTACSNSKCTWGASAQRTLTLRPGDASFNAIKAGHPGDTVRVPCENGSAPVKARLISVEDDPEIRVHYVYFNGKEMPKQQIDSLRQVVEEELGRGVPFEQLAARYTMDGNLTGALDWTPASYYVPEFSKAVLAHKKGDVFRVDTPYNDWYHVVRKDEDHRNAVKVVAERIH